MTVTITDCRPQLKRTPPPCPSTARAVMVAMAPDQLEAVSRLAVEHGLSRADVLRSLLSSALQEAASRG